MENRNPLIEEEMTTKWLKEKVQKDKKRSTKHTHKGKDRVIRNPLKSVVNSDAPEGSPILIFIQIKINQRQMLSRLLHVIQRSELDLKQLKIHQYCIMCR